MEPTTGTWWADAVQYGHYATVRDLVKAINDSLSTRVGNNIKFTYNSLATKTIVEIKSGYAFSPSSLLAFMIGFGGKEVVLKKKQPKAHTPQMCLLYQTFMCIVTLFNLRW